MTGSVAVAVISTSLLAGWSSTSASADDVVRDGSTAGRAAASCWAIKQLTPTAPSGIYYLQTPKLIVPQQFYCDQTTDGGGWVLLGRGREGWTWDDAGQSSASIPIASTTIIRLTSTVASATRGPLSRRLLRRTPKPSAAIATTAR